jgi:hypothetical protein
MWREAKNGGEREAECIPLYGPDGVLDRDMHVCMQQMSLSVEPKLLYASVVQHSLFGVVAACIHRTYFRYAFMPARILSK